MKVDDIELTQDEFEAWEERIAICMEDGLIGQESAEKVAADQIRRMRNADRT